MRIEVLICAVSLAAIPLHADDAAVIEDSGSTNTAGYRIVVERSGKAVFTPARRKSGARPEETKPRKVKIPKELVRRFYADLEAGKPLADLPRQGCMKSASFGTVVTVEFAGQTTPDLSCGDHGDSRLSALIRDTSAIRQLFSRN